jgi:flavin-dependent dehydrogenase
MRDVLIAGGGPAGLAAGIRAAQLGLDAVIVEPKRAPIDKACGEGLMPAALTHLAGLGIEGLDGHVFRGIRYLDAYDPTRSAAGDFAGQALGVRRTELHRRLSRRADQVGVERIVGRVERIDHTQTHIQAAGVRAHFLIGADGLHSRVRRQLGVGLERRHPKRFGVRRHFRCAPWTDRVEVYWGKRGEAYVTPVGPATVGVAFLVPGGGRFSELLDHFPALAARIDGSECVSQARGGGPFEQRVAKRVHRRVLLVGDAAGYLDPLTGEGVALGVQTASAAVEAIAAGQPSHYETTYRQITRNYYWLTGLLLQISRRRWLHAPMIDVLDRVPVLFDQCLELMGGRHQNVTLPACAASQRRVTHNQDRRDRAENL